MRTGLVVAGIILALILAPASAQMVYPATATVDTSALATKSDVAAAQTAATAAATAAVGTTYATKAELAANACPPGTTPPQMEAVTAIAGTASSCLRSDSKAPRITRAGVVSTNVSTGAWSIDWTTPLPAAPLTLPIPINAGTQPITCNVATSSATGATGKCWVSRTLPATLLALTRLVSYDIMGLPPAVTSVQVFAIPLTQ